MAFAIRYNHIGYSPTASKEFLVVSDSRNIPSNFEIVSKNGKSFFEGSMHFKSFCDYTNEFVFVGNFSDFTEKGNFKIKIEKCETPFFEISDKWISRQLASTLKSFYYQRSGIELSKDRAGLWAREASHIDDDLKFHPCMERAGTWNAHGGWYDAGDYGKYIVNGGISVAILLTAMEFSKDRPKKIDNDSEFDNDSFHKTLLEELRFELEFFLRMQDNDGGVFFKVSPVRWDPFVTPAESDKNQKRLILGKSTTSTLNFAGALAQAHRVFKNTDLAFARQCLDASLKAYDWAKTNPDIPYPNNTEGSGPYADTHFGDEFFWARAMLYRELGEYFKDKSLLKEDMKSNPPRHGLDWRDTQNMGWLALALQEHDLELQNAARNAFKATADDIVKLSKEDAYALSIRKFIWGSNGDIANHALTLLIANSWFNIPDYIAAAERMLDFIYGKNPVNKCFVTGAAWSSPKFLHHRISHSDKIAEPIPGFVAGGINSDRQDLRRKPTPHYPNDLPGFSYSDEQSSFASNEVAINWNAPLVAILSLL